MVTGEFWWISPGFFHMLPHGCQVVSQAQMALWAHGLDHGIVVNIGQQQTIAMPVLRGGDAGDGEKIWMIWMWNGFKPWKNGGFFWCVMQKNVSCWGSSLVFTAICWKYVWHVCSTLLLTRWGHCFLLHDVQHWKRWLNTGGPKHDSVVVSTCCFVCLEKEALHRVMSQLIGSQNCIELQWTLWMMNICTTVNRCISFTLLEDPNHQGSTSSTAESD